MATNTIPTPRRRHRTRAEADQLADEYEASGLRCEDFCQQRGVPLKTLSRYVTRYRKQRQAQQSAQPVVEVEVTSSSAAGNELAVLLRTGRRIEVRQGFDPTTLRQLVAVLE